MMYYAGFDCSLLSLGNLTLATSGQTDAVVDLTAVSGTDQNGDSTTRHFHYSDGSGYDVIGEDADSTQRALKYSTHGFWSRLQAAIQAAIAAQSWPGSFSLTWDNSDGSTTWSYTAATFTLTWSAAAGRRLCGFSANQSGSTSYNSDITPDYAISPTLESVSIDGPHEHLDFEPGGIANRIVDDAGIGYSQARTVAPLIREWKQEHETKAKTFRLSAASTHPWSLQALFEHCRKGFLFLVYDGFSSSFTTEAFSLHGDSVAWRPFRASTAIDTLFHVHFKAYLEGRVVGGA